MDQVFECTEDERLSILAFYGRTPSTFLQDVEDVRTWLQLQPHLPEVPCDRAIESFLLLNKMSVERTKKKIDMYYTIRGIFPDLFVPPDDPRVRAIVGTVIYLPLPKLTRDNCRVTLCTLTDPDVEKFDMTTFIWYVLHMAEVRLLEDCALSEITILDMRNLRMAHVVKVSPSIVKKLHTIVDKAFASRYHSIHFVHPAALVDNLVSMVKTVVPEKIGKRIQVHRDVDSLKEHVSVELLPKDYGGNLASVQELNGKLLRRLDFHKERIADLMRMRTDERLRVGQPVTDDDVLIGVHGNFRKLDVD